MNRRDHLQNCSKDDLLDGYIEMEEIINLAFSHIQHKNGCKLSYGSDFCTCGKDKLISQIEAL